MYSTIQLLYLHQNTFRQGERRYTVTHGTMFIMAGNHQSSYINRGTGHCLSGPHLVDNIVFSQTSGILTQYYTRVLSKYMIKACYGLVLC